MKIIYNENGVSWTAKLEKWAVFDVHEILKNHNQLNKHITEQIQFILSTIMQWYDTPVDKKIDLNYKMVKSFEDSQWRVYLNLGNIHYFNAQINMPSTCAFKSVYHLAIYILCKSNKELQSINKDELIKKINYIDTILFIAENPDPFMHLLSSIDEKNRWLLFLLPHETFIKCFQNLTYFSTINYLELSNKQDLNPNLIENVTSLLNEPIDFLKIIWATISFEILNQWTNDFKKHITTMKVETWYSDFENF